MDKIEKMDYLEKVKENKLENLSGSMVVNRQAQEVQAAMIIAKKFPRDETDAYSRIMRACKRKGLASNSEYTYPRGGEKVNGPTIRLAEAIAQNWGNIDYGIIELTNSGGKSEVMAYAWDLETNTRSTKIFTVNHIRYTKKKTYRLTDPRDVYEITANNGARRVRACIMAIIPGDIIEDAIEKCRETLREENQTPFSDRLKKMVTEFYEKHQVTKDMIEEYIGYNINSFSEHDLIKLRGVYASLTDGMSKRNDYFEVKEKKQISNSNLGLSKDDDVDNKVDNKKDIWSFGKLDPEQKISKKHESLILKYSEELNVDIELGLLKDMNFKNMGEIKNKHLKDIKEYFENA